ncbi:MAG: hypothetical protein Q4D29_10425 [Lachnospiraceae bacterium]|nr:hypothetical protein [Lachnospiraceae bacterium]
MSRETSRIDPMIEEYKKLWEKHSDLRFGQLVCNIVPENQLFYVEDDIMLERIQDWDKSRR